MDQLKVQKKDGRLEDFNRSKIYGGIIRSGALPETAEAITVQVEQWAKMNSADGIVKSLDVRAKVLEFLRQKDADSAMRYEVYKKTPPTP